MAQDSSIRWSSSLTWGGKRDYTRWFSAEPSAILGMPMLAWLAAVRLRQTG